MIHIKNLRDNKTIPLDIPKGYYVLVEMTTMAGYHISVAIRDADTKQEYFRDSRQGLDPIPPISKFYRCDSERSELYIDIPQSRQIDFRMDSMDIENEKGTLLIRTVTAVGEDADDADYNDFILNLSIMKSKV